jgi:hypothetical protein
LGARHPALISARDAAAVGPALDAGGHADVVDHETLEAATEADIAFRSGPGSRDASAPDRRRRRAPHSHTLRHALNVALRQDRPIGRSCLRLGDARAHPAQVAGMDARPRPAG